MNILSTDGEAYFSQNEKEELLMEDAEAAPPHPFPAATVPPWPAPAYPHGLIEPAPGWKDSPSPSSHAPFL